MGLLSIQEPETASAQDNVGKIKIALGIDLGTTHSLVGAYLENNVVLFKNNSGEVLLPSVVLYSEHKQTPLVGQKAIFEAKNNKENAIFSVKRLIGKSATDLSTTFSPITREVKPDIDNLAVLKTAHGIKSPVQISAEILKELAQIAHVNLAQYDADYEVAGVVITVPAYFDDGQRQATKAAAELAGMKVLRLLNEPTAAALAYGYDRDSHQGIYLVYDLGGGTFDVSILKFHEGIFEVLATAGDTALGGDDMDACIMNALSISWDEAKKIKEALTDSLVYPLVYQDVLTENAKIVFTRAQFDVLIKNIVDKTIEITKSCLKDAKIELSKIAKVILVGGASRVPAIHVALEQAFGLPLSQEMDPDKVVAMGAALQAAKLMGQTDTVLLDVVPLSLGIELMGGVTEKIIARNTKLPISITQVYTTYQDNQTGFKIQVVQGERELAKDNRALASFELTGLPALPQGKLRINMTFTVDVDGLLTVTAKEMLSNQSHQVEVKPTYGLTRVDIDSAILNAAACAKQDITERQLIEAKREANKLIDYAKHLLADCLATEMNINQELKNLIQLIDSDNTQDIISAIKNLESRLMPMSLARIYESKSKNKSKNKNE